jgi:hypothetical protein
VERQGLFKEKINLTISRRRTDLDINSWPYDVANGLRSGSKTVLGPGRSCLLPGSKSYVAPSLQCARDIYVRVQARAVMQGEPEEGRT